MKINLEPAYVLHRRPYRDTSLIVELFTLNHGRVSVVARSARGLKSRYKGKLEMFSPLLVSWVGRHELKTLGNIEMRTMSAPLSDQALLCSFYLNELLMRLLQREDPCPNLFHCYEQTLQKVKIDECLQLSLRCFEKKLLHELGYGLPLTKEMDTNQIIHPKSYYRFVPERGFIRCEKDTARGDVFSGVSILALQNENFQDDFSLKEAKRLMRMVLSQHLGNKPIKTRELM